MSIKLTRFDSAMWSGFSGANKLPDGSDPLSGAVVITNLPFTPEMGEKEGVFILDGGYADDSAEGVYASLNYTTEDGTCVHYERRLPASVTVESAVAWFEMSMAPAMTHEVMLAAGFGYWISGEEQVA